MGIPFVISILLAMTLTQTSHAEQSLLTGASCNENNLYLEGALRAQNVLSSSSDPNCPDCMHAVTPFNDINRLSQNSQIIAQSSGNDPLTNQPLLANSCFIYSMEHRPTSKESLKENHYAACKSGDASIALSESSQPPCVTTALITSVQTALQQTMSCLGVDQKDILPLLSVVSSLQINLHGSNGIGMGGLTSSAIDEADEAEYFAEDLNKPECQQFQSYFQQSAENKKKLTTEASPDHTANPCGFLSLPDNPTRNLLYSGAIYRMNQRLAESLATGLGTTSSDSAQIATELARSMYNAGSEGIQSALRLFEMRIHHSKLNYQDFSAAFSKFLKSDFEETITESSSSTRKKTVSRFASSIEEEARKINGSSPGTSCAN